MFSNTNLIIKVSANILLLSTDFFLNSSPLNFQCRLEQNYLELAEVLGRIVLKVLWCPNFYRKAAVVLFWLRYSLNLEEKE